jgi:peptidoglycan/LPS O-acetylase OafA/YrhL
LRKRTKYIKRLDVVRVLAIIPVIITHWGPHKFRSAILTLIISKIVPPGTRGVDLFFALSGYLITKILLFASEEGADQEKLMVFKNLYIRQSLRLKKNFDYAIYQKIITQPVDLSE